MENHRKDTKMEKSTCTHTVHEWEDWESAPFSFFLKKYVVISCNKKRLERVSKGWKFCPYCAKPIKRRTVRDK